jgi:hypothetical protein
LAGGFSRRTQLRGVSLLFTVQYGEIEATSLIPYLIFSIYLILPAALWPGLTQRKTEISTRNPARKADSLTAVYDPIV